MDEEEPDIDLRDLRDLRRDVQDMDWQRMNTGSTQPQSRVEMESPQQNAVVEHTHSSSEEETMSWVIEGGYSNDNQSVNTVSEASFDFGGSDTDSDAGNDTPSNQISKRFDADLVVKCIQRGEPTLQRIDNRDCVLVVGKTGTGKSTLIQAIAGKKIQATQLDHSDEDIHQHTTDFMNPNNAPRKRIVYEAVDPLPDFEIGHEKKSKTTSINCYDYDPNQDTQRMDIASRLYSHPASSELSNIMFVDSPGFEDTNGYEIDVATSILLSEVAKRCRSLKFVIMISYVSLVDDRGGSMRSVLRLIRSFAKNFAKEKQSFMFLFTHCNEIRGVADTIDGAKRSLYQEIVQIMNGTEDEDTKEVLKFIKKSLNKGFPFVNVFLPLQTNVQDLIMTIKESIKRTKDPYIAHHCGLTQSSRLTLSGELQHRLQELQRDMSGVANGHDLPMDDICAGLQLFEYFHRYINTQDTRDTMQEAKRLLETFVKENVEILQTGMEKATGPDHDFGPADINGIKKSFKYLQILQEKYPKILEVNVKDMEAEMFERMDKFSKSLMIGMGQSFNGMHRNLTKLKVWSSYFPQYIQHYESVKNHLFSLIQQYLIQCETKNKIANFLKFLSLDELSNYIRDLVVLYSIHQDEEYLSPHGFDIKYISHVYQSAVKSIKLSVELMGKSTHDNLKSLHINDLKLREIGDISRTIEHLDRLLMQSLVFPELKKLVENFKQQLSDNVTEYLETIVSQISFDDIEHSKVNVGRILHQTKLASETFNGIGEDLFSERISIIYNKALNETKLVLMKRMGEVEQMTQDVKRQGFKDGAENANMICGLRHLCWFDYFLPDDGKFVQNSCIAFERVFLDQINQVRSEAEILLHQIVDESHYSEPSVKTLRALMPVLDQVSIYAKATETEGSELNKEVRKRLLDVVASCTEKCKVCMKDWEKIFLIKNSNMCMGDVAGKFEQILRKRNLLQDLDAQCNVQIALSLTQVETTMDKISNYLKKIMEASENYEEKFRLFQIVHAMRKFTNISQYLPRLEDLQLLARNSIASDAKRIHVLVNETTLEWDKIDNHLELFKKATILDEFTQNEASSRIAPLLELRESKQEQVDNNLDQMITDGDFKGLRDFLSLYAESKDQIKNQQFRKWLFKLSSMLRDTVGSICGYLEGDMSPSKSKSIINGLQKLEQAEQHLSQYLMIIAPDAPVIGDEILRFRQVMNRKFQSLLTDLESAIKGINFESMGIKYHFIQAYSLLIKEEYIGCQKVNNKMESLCKDYKRLVTGDFISASVQRYINSNFKDIKELSHVLTSLKNAAECTQPNLHDLKVCYNSVREELIYGLNMCATSMKEYLSNTQSYDDVIDVMNSLDRHLKCELKDHIDGNQLLFRSGDLLREWQDEKQKIDHEMEFDGSDAREKLHQWKSMLDRLDPSRNVLLRNFQKFVSGTTYRQKVMKINRIVSDRSASGKKALEDGNYSLLAECMKILDLIHENLGKHASHANECSFTLQQSAKEQFLGICDRAKDILQSDNHIQFESVFSDYRGLILYVPCVMKDVQCKRKYSVVNQLIHDALKSDIKKVHNLLGDFAFDTVHKEIIRARKFGNFIADHCTLLKEEINRCNHIKTDDEWLQKIFDICDKHYSSGRILWCIKYFAILELPPLADESAVRRAYKRLAKKYHPDKSGSNETKAFFQSITETKEKLLNIISSEGESELPFGTNIKDIGISLRKAVKKCLDEQRYDRVERILFAMKDLKSLSNLVSPPLNHGDIIDEIHQLVGSNVRQAKTTVESSWSLRDYKALNDAITDLRMMEEKFKSYENIFPSSWDDGIVRSVENEIQDLGSHAQQYLSNNKSANENLHNFKRCFLNMGHIFIELPLFKDFTKDIMSRVLDECLQYDWGYSFLFEFGLGLQRGDENGNEDDKNIAQIIVAEFSHFKEVMTMVWNEETSRKPAEDTIQRIKATCRVNGVNAAVNLDKNQLLESYRKFEAEYKKLLGEYIIPEADLNTLVSKTISLAEKLQPLDLSAGWNENVKNQIPCILAGVFTVFTVLKSGASYNQLESTSTDARKLLMKPHNIQVLTLLSLFGCGTSNSESTGLDSQLMQIRTGEGKSMILGAAAVVLAMLGFRVRCVCYSEYLSARDFNLFQDIFDTFCVTDYVKYSKITTLSEDTTAAKGDIRGLTNALLQKKLADTSILAQNTSNKDTSSTRNDMSIKRKKKISQKQREENKTKITRQDEVVTATRSGIRKEILLVDEVDVFFGGDFYGQTYNQVTQFREPEIVEILKHIWITNKHSTRRQRLADIKLIPSYCQLVAKMPQFKALIDAEISLMIDQVRKIDEVPYYLDTKTDRIGYKVMDSISFEATYGYRTVFAYLQEAERGNLHHKDETLKRALAMPISCGQFSYAEISPECILGVSGTLSALDDFEYNVLSKYGVNKFIYVPSVYGESNFQFDKAGNGISIDTTKSDYFHSITNKINELTKKKRAVIVFFESNSRLEEFTESSFYPKLGRQKKLLKENLSKGEKEFIITKAATTKQITISTAVFGRGTDFFCKDEIVQKNGGVHVIQTFLSEEESEEIQIQGRTARQGKRGSYEMILLASDLEEKFDVPRNMKDNIAKNRWYEELCDARERFRNTYHDIIEKNLNDATEKDKATHDYFDSLLSKKEAEAITKFNDLYKSFKKGGKMPSTIELDIALLVDLTGSMTPYAPSIVVTVNKMLRGTGSISEKLKSSFPDIEFTVRVGIMGYRDIDDDQQFIETTFDGASHFTTDINAAINHLKLITECPSDGGDLAEDHLGAINRSSKWNADDDWTSPIKFILLLTDAPAHGMIPNGSKEVANVDNYAVLHPHGLTGETVIDSLVRNEIDLFLCSFNPNATSSMEQTLSALYLNHPDNTEKRQVTSIPIVSSSSNNEIVQLHASSGWAEVLGGHQQHIIFVLDMSGSMSSEWSGVEVAYNKYIKHRRQSQNECDLVSVVQFDNTAQITADMLPISQAPSELKFRGGMTCFFPAADSAFALASKTPSTHTPIVVFMSDGLADDADAAVGKFSDLNRNIRQTHGNDLELHVIAFGGRASMDQLEKIAGSSQNGKFHTSANTVQLSNIFVQIAGGAKIAAKLEAEIGKRISEAVSDRLSVEYLG